MSFSLGLRALIATDAAVAALVGTRIYPVQLPQGAVMPAITYFAVSGDREKSNSGPQNFGWTRFQVDAWALTYMGALALADAVLARVDGYRGTFDDGGAPPVSYTVQGAFLAGERDLYESEPKQYRVSRDYMIWFAGS